MELIFTERFKKAVLKLDQINTMAVEKALRLFVENPKHPGLNFERLTGSNYRTIRANRSVRVILRPKARDTYEVVDVGPHDINRSYG